MKPSFIVLETKVLNDKIYIYGGLVYHGGDDTGRCMANFQWYRLEDLK